jgi:hypothetical protein
VKVAAKRSRVSAAALREVAVPARVLTKAGLNRNNRRLPLALAL